MENKYSRQSFNKLLHSPVKRPVFNVFLNTILEKDPYFTPGYLELLWEADEKKNKSAFQERLKKTIFELNYLYVKPKLRRDVLENWSSLELEDLKVILLLALKKGNFSFFRRIVIRKQFLSIDKFFNIKTVVSPKETEHLKLIDVKNIGDFRSNLNELQDSSSSFLLKRSEKNPTNYYSEEIIFLKKKPSLSKYKSRYKDFLINRIKEFPKIFDLVFRLANELELDVVKIRVVNIAPFEHRYNPGIPSCELRRYCFVVDCNGLCVFQSGDEKKVIKQGDLWFFDINTRQLNYNLSETKLRYVIFDGYSRC